MLDVNIAFSLEKPSSLIHKCEMAQRLWAGEPEIRKGVSFERTVHVSAEKLGISGVLDLVEVETKTGRLKPVEYKRGKPKPDPMDEIQLCAQGLCLEEMTGQIVSEGALWYMQTRHRIPVVFSDDLRTQTLATIAAVRDLLNSGHPRRLTTANAAKPARWWRSVSRSCWGNGIGVWGMWRGCLGKFKYRGNKHGFYETYKESNSEVFQN